MQILLPTADKSSLPCSTRLPPRYAVPTRFENLKFITQSRSESCLTGIMHLKWSADGVYLLVAERQSDCVQVFDVRSMVRQVSVLSGRRAVTTQRMGVDLVQRPTGCQLWAGGTDGVVRMWDNAGHFEGELKPDAELKLHTGEHFTLDHRTMVG